MCFSCRLPLLKGLGVWIYEALGFRVLIEGLGAIDCLYSSKVAELR